MNSYHPRQAATCTPHRQDQALIQSLIATNTKHSSQSPLHGHMHAKLRVGCWDDCASSGVDSSLRTEINCTT
eukprot:9308783-Pyramimonas_sp.AAC.1